MGFRYCRLNDKRNSWPAAGGAISPAAASGSCVAGGNESRRRARGGRARWDVAGSRVHRLSPGLGTGAPRPRASGGDGGRRRATAQGDDVLLPERAGDRAGRAHGRGDCRARTSVHYAGSGTEATFYALRIARAIHRPQQGAEVRRRVARHARLRAVGHRADRAVRLSAREGGFGRRAAASRRDRCWWRRSTKRRKRSR